MIQANRIRQFTLDHYVAPARAEGRAEIIIRAGDVHQAMGLTNAMPAVCSAIGSKKIDEFAGVTRSALTGAANGYGSAVVLVSCVKSKLSHSAPPRALYTSAWFRKVDYWL